MQTNSKGDAPDLVMVAKDEGRQDLSEHLSELRGRLIRSVIYIALGMVAMYISFPWLFKLLSAPIIVALHQVAAHRPPDERQFAGAYVFRNFYEPFFLRLQLSLVAGLVIAAPLITIEGWGFILPALTPKERRSVRLVAPFSAFLFLMGATLAFFIMPLGIHWFLLYLSDFPGAVLLQDPQDYILFLVKMILAFGLVFQLPVVLMGLGRFGIIRSRMLKKNWRYCVVGISIVAMIVTPSNDPFSMIVMTIPLLALFFLSIWLVQIVEPKTPEPVGDATIAL